ncbi:hypothetical protein K502DRAFT_342962 [Neoconidiobolus thromboides FSU 785]|nr:hypothetical protein K502DRAFT_342962 [Neoconidiobolus thromboides FSU 785]
MLSVDQLLNHVSSYINYVLIGFGIILVAFGIAFLVVNRRLIKFLYFVSGVQIFASLSFLIGSTIIYSSNIKDPNNYTPLYILFGTSAGLGLVGGILGAYFTRFGSVLVGLAGGLNLWQLVAGFIKNPTLNLVFSILLAIVGGILCGFFKNPIEVVLAAFTGSHLFTKGLFLITQGAMVLSALPNPKLVKYLYFAMIGEVCLKALVFIINAAIHLMRYFSENGEAVDQETPESQPMLERDQE